MSSNFRKHFGSFIPILKSCARYNVQRNSSACFVKSDITKLKMNSLLKGRKIVNELRKVSSSNLANANDSNPNESGGSNEQNKNVLNDDEFRSILSDFAKDFGVESDSEQILDEIRSSLDDVSSESDDTSDKEENCSTTQKIDITTDNKFKEFSEADAVVIQSSEELQSEPEGYTYHVNQPIEVQYSLDLKRGVSGVYDIDELIEVLRKENLDGITVISVPKELHYTDFLVIATAKSPRHSEAVCEKVVKIYKMKKHLKDPFVIVEGEKTSDWKVLDMGNLVLHVFLEEQRALYDIESLWLFDRAFDRGGNQKHDPLYNEIEQQMAFFNALNESSGQESNPTSS